MIDVGICEGDGDLRALICRGLRDVDITVRETAWGIDALRAFTADPPDVLILGAELPDIDGLELCAGLRRRGMDKPVMFTAVSQRVIDRLAGFRAGGDDYLCRPFDLAELVVRVEALARRGRPRSLPGEATGLAVDPATHALTVGRARVVLTPTEFRIAATLLANTGDVVRRETLVQTAWPLGARVRPNTLHTYIARVRRKLEAIGAPMQISCVRGVGYAMHNGAPVAA